MELMNLPRIGEVIKEYRIKSGLSQQQLGEKLGITATPRQRVYQWESGARLINSEDLLRVCALLRIPLEAFDEYAGGDKS